jgi:hypothetical protein
MILITKILLNTQVQLQEDLDQKARSSASIFLYLYTTVNYRFRLTIVQRVLKVLERARLCCGRMIRLHAHLLPPSPVSKLDKTGRLRKKGI